MVGSRPRPTSPVLSDDDQRHHDEHSSDANTTARPGPRKSASDRPERVWSGAAGRFGSGAAGGTFFSGEEVLDFAYQAVVT